MLLGIPCLQVHENQYLVKKCVPEVSTATLQEALDAIAVHPNCAGVTLENGLYSGRETLQLQPSPDGKNETSYFIMCDPPSTPPPPASPPPPPLLDNWWETSPPPSPLSPPASPPSPPTPSPPPMPPPPPVPPADPPQVPPSPVTPPPPLTPPPPPSPPPKVVYDDTIWWIISLFAVGTVIFLLLGATFLQNQLSRGHLLHKDESWR